MPAHVRAHRLERPQDVRVARALLIFVSIVLTMIYFRQPVAVFADDLLTAAMTEQTPYLSGLALATSGKEETLQTSVRMDFVPPSYLEQDQLDNIELVRRIIADPSSVGLSDKSPLDLDHNAVEVYLSMLEYESNYRHTDEAGNIKYSYTGCCVGITQIALTTGVCERWELFILERNIWCGARVYEGYYHTWKDRAGDRAFEITVAMYKNAVVMKPDLSDFLPDENGLPIIPPDDPEDPMDFHSQIATVFIHPSTGESRFSFTTIE